LFVSAIDGEAVELANESIKRLSALCDEFEFRSLSQRLETCFPKLKARMGRLTITNALKSLLSAQEPTAPAPPPSTAPKKKAGPAAALSRVRAQAARPAPAPAPAPARPNAVPAAHWSNSVIVPDFPKLFEDFKDQKFTLLWRGSRDGFKAKTLHRHCDWQPNTLTVILDTKGNIFGGFIPVTWETAGQSMFKPDPNLKSFLFTLKNPHNVPARRFALNAQKKDRAILCSLDRGPNFVDIFVSDGCNAKTGSGTYSFGDTYTNDTELKGTMFFTGSEQFEVNEIEVFAITH
jgi:hypothetical protein